MLATTKIPLLRNFKPLAHSLLSNIKLRSDLQVLRRTKATIGSILRIRDIANQDFDYVSDFNAQIIEELES